jgi:hypothetical protein
VARLGRGPGPYPGVVLLYSDSTDFCPSRKNVRLKIKIMALYCGVEVPIWALRVPVFASLIERTGEYQGRTMCVYYANTKLSAKAHATTIIFGHSLEGMSVSIMVPISSSSMRTLLRP